MNLIITGQISDQQPQGLQLNWIPHKLGHNHHHHHHPCRPRETQPITRDRQIALNSLPVDRPSFLRSFQSFSGDSPGWEIVLLPTSPVLFVLVRKWSSDQIRLCASVNDLWLLNPITCNQPIINLASGRRVYLQFVCAASSVSSSSSSADWFRWWCVLLKHHIAKTCNYSITLRSSFGRRVESSRGKVPEQEKTTIVFLVLCRLLQLFCTECEIIVKSCWIEFTPFSVFTCECDFSADLRRSGRRVNACFIGQSN